MIRLALAALVASSACRTGGDELSGAVLEEKWRTVVAAARPRVPPGDPELLERAIQVLSPQRDAVREALALDPPVISPEASATALALTAWYEERGGLPPLTCGDMAESGRRIMALVTLADVALAGASADDRQRRVEAALYLGHRLRAEGPGVLVVMAGSEISDDAIRFAGEHEIRPSAAFTELAPAADLAARAVAAEASCTLAIIDSISPDERPAPPDFDRLRRFFIGAFEDAQGDEVVRRLEHRIERARAEGGAAAEWIPSLAGPIEAVLEKRQRYHAFLRGIR